MWCRQFPEETARQFDATVFRHVMFFFSYCCFFLEGFFNVGVHGHRSRQLGEILPVHVSPEWLRELENTT